MASEKKTKIAYLFGAGATHAEILALFDNEIVRETHGLLISDVSARVIQKARADQKYVSDLERVSGTSGSPIEKASGTSGQLNIELLISLIENSKIHDWASKTASLKRWVERDIRHILTQARLRRFYLHGALLRLHAHEVVREKEEVVGFISLNYDDVLDRAYTEYYGKPNYCFTLDETMPSTNVPLLKLHGSFNWNDARMRGRPRKIDIIPLGSIKSYVHAPYASIWNRALEVLVNCDRLRVVGCSLSPNDVHLIDLLFKAHLERQEAFDIDVIASASAGENIRENYGFFPKINTLVEIENMISERDPPNPFELWLKYKSDKMLGPTRLRLKYLRNVV